MRIRSIQVLVLIGLALLAPITATTARAQGFIDEVKIGVLAHDMPGMWSGLSVEARPVAFNAEVLFSPSLPLFGGTVRPVLGGSFSGHGSTSNIYLDARWQYETSYGLFFGLGVGGTVHNGQLQLENLDRKALGSRVLFHIPVEIGYRLDRHNSISAYFEHISNAYTVSPNEGLDRLGIRYGYKF